MITQSTSSQTSEVAFKVSASYTNIIKIVIDADSLVYKSCYRHQLPDGGGVNIEQAYLEFGFEIGKIKSAVFRLLKYAKGDKVEPIIVLSPKRSFRHDLDEEYKGNRPTSEPIHGIKALKLMIMHRLKNALVVKNVEADDVCIWFAQNKEYLISAIDKDVINACPTSCYDYNKRRWESPHLPYEIEEWYTRQALMGDSTDNIKGAEGMGIERSLRWISKFEGELYSWSEYCDLFGGEALAEQAMNLVRMDGLVRIDGKLIWKPWNISKSNYWEY